MFERLFFVLYFKKEYWYLLEIDCSHYDNLQFKLYDPLGKRNISPQKHELLKILQKYIVSEIKDKYTRVNVHDIDKILKQKIAKEVEALINKLGKAELNMEEANFDVHPNDSGLWVCSLLYNFVKQKEGVQCMIDLKEVKSVLIRILKNEEK